MYIMGIIWEIRQALEVEFRNHGLMKYDFNANTSPKIKNNFSNSNVNMQSVGGGGRRTQPQS